MQEEKEKKEKIYAAAKSPDPEWREKCEANPEAYIPAPVYEGSLYSTEDVSLDEIYRNEQNKYSLGDVEKLAAEIELTGILMHNLVAVYDPNPKNPREKFRLVSGERRWLALKMLAEKYKNTYNDGYNTVSCLTLLPATPAQERLMLIIANSQREKTLGDRIFEYEGLKSALEEIRDKDGDYLGRNLKEGRLRDHMAEILQTATGTLAQLEKMSNFLTPKIRALAQEGRITYTAAAMAADLAPEDQDALAGMWEGKEEPLTKKEVAAQKHESTRQMLKNRYETRACPAKPILQGCDNAENLASFYRDGSTTGCAGCCYKCANARECPKCCDAKKADIAEMDALGEEIRARDEVQARLVDAQGEPEAQEDNQATAWGEIDAHPEHAGSMCWTCENVEACAEKSDKVITCDRYSNPAERADQDAPAPSPVMVYQQAPQRTDEQLLGYLRTTGLSAIAAAEMISQTERERLNSLLAAMWQRWTVTGQWSSERQHNDQ